MSALESLLYTSNASHEFDQSELDELLVRARAFNHGADITGMLLYRSGRFVQVLEGPGDALRELMDRIAADPRHGDVRILIDAPIRERSFSEWSMGYQLAADPTGEPPAGFRDTFADLDEASDPSVIQRAARELSMWFRVRADPFPAGAS